MSTIFTKLVFELLKNIYNRTNDMHEPNLIVKTKQIMVDD